MNRSNTQRKSKFVTLYCNQSTQTQDSELEGQDNSETDDSDFPPCLIGNAPPLMSCYSPVQVTVPSHSRYYPREAASNIQRHLTISSEEPEEPPQSQSRCHCRQPNTGLGQTNIVNTVDSDTTAVLHTKVVLIYSLVPEAMLMANETVRAAMILLFVGNLY